MIDVNYTEYITTIAKGIGFGITLSLIAGPAMFALIQTSLTNGFKSGVYFATGISLSDILMVYLALLGFSSLMDTPRNKIIFSVVGGIIMIIFGTYTFLRKSVKNESVSPLKMQKKPFFGAYIGKGFLFNIANPSVWFYWLIPVGIASALPTKDQSYLFLIALLVTVFSFDLLKCAISYKLKTILTPKIIHVINKVVGIILMVIGIYFIISEFININPFPHRV